MTPSIAEDKCPVNGGFLRLGVMFSLPSCIVSRHDDDLVSSRVGSLYRGEAPRGLGPWAGALVGYGDKIVQTWTSHGVEEALTLRAAKRKSLAPD